MKAKDLLSIESDLLYFTNKYIDSTKNGKANPRLAKQLITLIEANEIYLLSKTKIQE
jgi:hypothetical protein